MAWGAPHGVEDLIAKLQENETGPTMCVLSTRKFGPADAGAFSTALAGNASLEELLASGHALGPAEAAQFGEALAENSTLRSLALGDQDLGDDGLQALVQGLKRNRGLLSLDLEYKSISAGEALRTLLEAHPTLTDLRLGRNDIGTSGATCLSAGLSKNSTLLRLNLSCNKLDAPALRMIGRALVGSPADQELTPPLEFLDVSGNALGEEGGVALFGALATGRGASQTLKVFRATETGLGAASATALAAALSPPSTAESEPVRQHDQAGDGQGAAVSGKEETRTPLPSPRGLVRLKALDLSKNELGLAGTVELAEALGRGCGPSLESLSLGYNGVTDEGAAAVGRAVGSGVHVLDFSGNGLTGKGVKGVLSARGLREARLFHNACGDEGVPYILEACQAGDSLETLDLGANGLTGAGLEDLLPGLAARSSLHTLEIGANSNDDRAEAAVRMSQTNNPGLDIAFRRAGEAMQGSGAPQQEQQ